MIAHFDEVRDRQIRQRVHALFSKREIFLERQAPPRAMPGQALIQHQHILKGGVGALTVKGHHRMTGVAQKHDPIAPVPGAATYRHQ